MSLLDSPAVREVLDRAGLGALPPRTLKAVLFLAAALVALGVWRFWPAAPEPELAFDAQPEPQEEATEAPPAEIVVHVAGAVMRPGVYHLPAGSRVADAVASAGGGLGSAALDSLNLARILSDGEQVYVLTCEQVSAGAGPPIYAAGVTPAPGVGGDTVNINQATAAELDSLPGVGPATAQKIVDDRETNGPFSTPEDLMRVPGIGPKKFELLRGLVVCN